MSDFEKNALIANLQNDIHIKDKECDELKVKLNAKDAKIHYLRSMYDDVNEKFEELRKDSSQLISKNVDLKRDMIILKDTVSDRESLIEKIKKDNTEICNCIKKNNETIGSLKKENEKLKRERDLLNLDTGRLNDEIKEKDKEIEKIKNERDWLESCYRSWIEESGSRAEKIKKLEKEKDDLDHILHSKIEALEGDIECRKKDLEYKNEQIEDLIERLDDQRKKIEDLENGDVLPYFIRKVVGDKLKEDPCCWASTAEKRSYIEDPFCKSVPCSEAIKQLEKKVDDIPCIKAKKTRSELDDAIKDYITKTPTPICWDDYWPINHLGEWNIIDPPYNKIAEHMMRKYQALRHAGFDHDTALSFIPMWGDE